VTSFLSLLEENRLNNEDKLPKGPDPAWLAHKERASEWREETTFTEVFLSQFSDPEDARTVRRFGQLIGCVPYESRSDLPKESLVPRDLRAVLADLRRLEYELAEVAKAPEYFVVQDRKDLKLCSLAGRKAFAVARIADAIEKAIGPAP
jgi:hypothetical protein